MQLSCPALILFLAGRITAAAASFHCALPVDADKYSVITSEDATIGAHSMYKGLAIGGTLFDATPGQDATVDKTTSYVKGLDPNQKFNFNGGLRQGETVNPLMMEQFKYLATSAQNSNVNGKKVVVVNSGGTYNMYDFNNGGQGEDNGNTVVIFNTSQDVVITKTNDGRQFGPSIIAPFAKVSVTGEAGYVDGLVVAKTFETTGSSQGSLQLHGDTYNGPFTCGSTTTGTTTTQSIPTASAPYSPAVAAPVVVPVPAPPVPVPVPQTNTCVAKWGECTNNLHGCCNGLVCNVQNQWYAQCLDAPPAKPPTMAPVRPPTMAPVKPPTMAPVKPPTMAPVKPPTMAPVRPPTKAPTTKAPTKAPVPYATKAPAPAPVTTPTKGPVIPRDGTRQDLPRSCLEQVNPTAICVSMEVYLTDVMAQPAQSCTKGEMVTVALSGSVQIASSRNDLAWWVALDGGDALTGSCIVDTLAEDSGDNYVFTNNGRASYDLDPCGDVVVVSTSSSLTTSLTTELLATRSIPCTDDDHDGQLDVAICFSWNQYMDGRCDNGTSSSSFSLPMIGDATSCNCQNYNFPQIMVDEDPVAAVADLVPC